MWRFIEPEEVNVLGDLGSGYTTDTGWCPCTHRSRFCGQQEDSPIAEIRANSTNNNAGGSNWNVRRLMLIEFAVGMALKCHWKTLTDNWFIV